MCGFVSQHKGVEGLHVYLIHTIHLHSAQDPRQGHGAVAPCVQGDGMCCLCHVESSAPRPTDTVHPGLCDSRAQELLAREDLLGVGV